jgi:hypothetical protein
VRHVPLIAAAVCPHPVLLVPEVAGEAAPELDDLRAACDEAVRRLLTADLLIVVGSGPTTHDYGAAGFGTLAPYGVDLTVGSGSQALPLSLSIGRWLVDRARSSVPIRCQSVAATAARAECLWLGALLARSADRVALLVMGDGSACRDKKAPGHLDVRAGGFDAATARALADADPEALARIDAGLAAELLVAGWAAWQVLAGAAHPGSYDGELLADEAPYGVGYHVASWNLRREAADPHPC